MAELIFSVEERARLAKICQALGTTFEEFCHHAVMQCVDEMEGLSREYRNAWRNV